ncbi:MAG: hypothetical protein LBB72_06040 [Spirochaetaceae bacterium]|jgi:hypothetical protein|nr:hypothetical protein [Spirochaetaceae bacterium]
MKLGQKIFVISLFLFIGLAFFTRNTAMGQTGAAALPREVLRPQYGEDPRFPRDYVIGELGRGDATEEAYRLAREIVASLAEGDGKVDRAVFPEQKRLAALSKIRAVGARSWRVGGGRAEGAGGYSFLVRFLGRERSITGELYLQWEEPKPPVVEEPAPADSEDTPAETEAAEEESAEEETAEAENAALETETPAAEEESTAAETAMTKTETAEPVNVPAEPETAEPIDVPAEPGTAAVDFNIPAIPDGSPPTETDAVANTTVTPAAAAAEEPRWRVDDILLESPRRLTDGKYSPGGADMTPYERFF